MEMPVLVGVFGIGLCFFVVVLSIVLIVVLATRKRGGKSRTIRRQIRGVGRGLKAKYGRQTYYTPGQVKTVHTSLGYMPIYMCYELATFCSADDFRDYHRNNPNCCDYGTMRHEIGTAVFPGGMPADAALAVDSCDTGAWSTAGDFSGSAEAAAGGSVSFDAGGGGGAGGGFDGGGGGGAGGGDGGGGGGGGGIIFGSFFFPMVWAKPNVFCK